MGSFLFMKIWCEAMRDMAAIVCLKLLSVWLGSTNLWSVFSVEWFLDVRKTLVDNSKQDTVDWYPVQSECQYLMLASLQECQINDQSANIKILKVPSDFPIK